MKVRNYAVLVLLSTLAACGGLDQEKGKLLTKNENADLVKSFDLTKDQAELYKEEQLNNSSPAIDTVKVENKKPSKKLKTKSAKKDKALSAEIVNKPAPAIAESSAYPADYPQILKDYDATSKSIWEKFKPTFYQGEQSIMAISYLGVTAGYITITSKEIVKINDKSAYHYHARFKSKDAYRYFYWLDDNIDTFIEKTTFLPIKYSLIQREKKQNVDDLELFDFNKLKTFHWYKRVKEGNNKNEKVENYIPRYSQDSFSALQFVRGLPLHKGDLYDFPVVTRGKPWLLKIEVMGEETISVNGDDIKAFRLKAETHFPGVLQKSGDINFWYSSDETRKLVKFQAKVKIGSIYGELVEHTPGVLVN